MNRLLLIEDEEVILKALKRLLERNHFDVSTATTVEQAIAQQPQSFDLILADLRLPGAPGTDIIALADPAPVIIMTSHAGVRSAVEAMRNGAIDYIAKPFDHDELLMVINQSLLQNRMRSQNQALSLDLQRLAPATIVSTSTSMQSLADTLVQLPEHQHCLHLYGERGSGMELLARTIHAAGDRNDAPLMIADLAGLPADTLRTRLLGGDSSASVAGLLPHGLLQAAHNGTLIVRHPDVMPHDTQQEFAEALQAGRMPGSAGQRAINVRTIAISNSPMMEHVSAGRIDVSFADLFLRNECCVAPLRDRREDITPMAQFYLRHYGERNNCSRLRFSDNAMAALLAYDWPGNVIELGNLIEHAVLIARDNIVEQIDLGLSALGAQATELQRDLNLDEYFRYYVLRYQDSLSETEIASRLGISRKSLWERRQKMQIARSGAAAGT